MRDAERHVRDALESVLVESHVPLEVLVIDDGSRDDSAGIVRSLADRRIKMIPGPQQGIAAAFNAGLARAEGEILMRCDADDRYVPGRIRDQVDWLRSHQNYGAVCGSFSTIDHRGKLLAALETGEVDLEITGEMQQGTTRTHLCTFAVQTRLLHALGGCRPYFVTAEDIDLQLRLAGTTRVWYRARPAYEYRLHESSVTHSQPNARRLFFENTARVFAAQRREATLDDLQRGCPPAVPSGRGESATASVHQAGMLMGQAWREHARGDRWQAVRTGWRACRARPTSLQSWKSLAALIVKRSAVARQRIDR